jgi:hypothetical protein
MAADRICADESFCGRRRPAIARKTFTPAVVWRGALVETL